MPQIPKAVLVLSMMGLAVVLQGCGGCTAEDVSKCITGAAGTNCEKNQKQIDCYKDCCSETIGGVQNYGKVSTGALKIAGDLLKCTTNKNACP